MTCYRLFLHLKQGHLCCWPNNNTWPVSPEFLVVKNTKLQTVIWAKRWVETHFEALCANPFIIKESSLLSKYATTMTCPPISEIGHISSIQIISWAAFHEQQEIYQPTRLKSLYFNFTTKTDEKIPAKPRLWFSVAISHKININKTRQKGLQNILRSYVAIVLASETNRS